MSEAIAMVANIEYLMGDFDPIGMWCKGNVTDQAFLDGVRYFNLSEHEENYIETNQIKHALIRQVPVRDADLPYSMQFVVAKEPGRGVFPITYWLIDGGELD